VVFLQVLKTISKLSREALFGCLAGLSMTKVQAI